MFHVVLIVLSGLLLVLGCSLLRTSPRVLSMILPRTVTFAVGLTLFVFAIFSAFSAAYIMTEPMLMLRCFVQGYVGMWLMLATTSGMRGMERDEEMLRRLFLMMGLVMGVIIASLYVKDPRFMAAINAGLVGAGFLVTTNYLRFLDRGR